MYQRALDGYEKAYGLEHTLTLDTVNNLGNIYANLGKLVEAENAYQRALKGYEITLGIHHERTREVLAAFIDLGIAPYRTLARRPDQAEIDSISKQHVEAIDNKVQSFPTIVDEVIRKELRGSRNCLSLILDSDLPGFVRQECSPGRSLGSLVVLTTNGNHTQATTCQKYLSWRWPSLSSSFLVSLETLVIDGESTTSSKYKSGLSLSLLSSADTFSLSRRTERSCKMEFIPRLYYGPWHHFFRTFRTNRGSCGLRGSFSLASCSITKVIIRRNPNFNCVP